MFYYKCNNVNSFDIADITVSVLAFSKEGNPIWIFKDNTTSNLKPLTDFTSHAQITFSVKPHQYLPLVPESITKPCQDKH